MTDESILPGAPFKIKGLAQNCVIKTHLMWHKRVIKLVLPLTDEKQPRKIPGLGALLPLLDHQQACEPKISIQAIREEQNSESISFISIAAELATRIGENAFALKMKDESMHPELKVNDILIIDPESKLYPGSKEQTLSSTY